MTRLLARFVFACFIVAYFATSAMGGVFEDALSAHERGDFPTALRLWIQLGKDGHVEAQIRVGGMYNKGEGVNQNSKEAARWFRLAAEQGNANAQYLLGRMYKDGRGVPQDCVAAYNWLQMAASQGDNFKLVDWTYLMLGRLFSDVKCEIQDNRTAASWFRKAAERGFPRAQYQLGGMYLAGIGVKKDEEEAVNWLTKAATNGSRNAEVELGVAYLLGRGVRVDSSEAARRFLKTANAGDSYAQYMFGMMLVRGQGVIQDYVEAHKWLNISAANGERGARDARDILALRMTPSQISDAQRLARDWNPN